VFIKLFDAAKVARFTPIERQAYEDSLKYYRDLKNVTDTARDEGRLEGLQTAAIAMYKNGLAVDFIAQTLNISLEAVKSWVSTEAK
jgi:DNA-binding NarL/FixJ family response regulator